MITLTNSFHGTQVALRANPGEWLSRRQIQRARRALCGVKGCTCGGFAGERGPQWIPDGRQVSVEPCGWHDSEGALVRIVPLPY